MARVTETISTINSFLRTLLAIAILAAVGGGGFYAYWKWYGKEHAIEQREKQLAEARVELEKTQSELADSKKELAAKEEQIVKLHTDIKKLEERVDRLETARRLLKMDHRLADIRVLDQTTDDKTGETTTKISYQEVNDEGAPLGKPREFTLKGDTVYVDYWVVKFDDKFVEEYDVDRRTSICMLKRIFGNGEPPDGGFTLDDRSTQPTAYARGGEASDFEKKIWTDFWTIANDPAKAKELGIRAAGGEAPNMKMQKDKTYKLEIRASGGTSIKPADKPAPPVPAGV